jgi:predicted nucleic acid-binding protein
MPKELFVDTSAWVALADGDDRYHARAAAAHPGLLRDFQRLVTTNLVVAESYIIIRLALGHPAAISFLESVRTSPRVERVYITESLDKEAEAILRQYQDQDFSLTDAVSFALMRRRGIAHAVAFDAHFATAGLTTLPAVK